MADGKSRLVSGILNLVQNDNGSFRVAGVGERQLETPGLPYAPLSPAPATLLSETPLARVNLV